MAVIYLKHAVHGAKVACSEQEAEYDELSGWVRYDPTQRPESLMDEPQKPQEPAQEPPQDSLPDFLQPANAMAQNRRRRAR